MKEKTTLRERLIQRNGLSKSIYETGNRLLEQHSPYKQGQRVESKSPVHVHGPCEIQHVEFVIEPETELIVWATTLVEGYNDKQPFSWNSQHDPLLKKALTEMLESKA